MRNLVLISALFALFLSGCAQKTYDYSAFLNSTKIDSCLAAD